MNKTVLGSLVVVILVLAMLAVVKMGSKSPSMTPDATPTAETATTDTQANPDIEIQDFAFTPLTLTVAPGAKVVVKNLDSASHTVTSDEADLFDTGLIAQNQTMEFTAPTTPGSYAFHCTPHPSMKATLVVQ